MDDWTYSEFCHCEKCNRHRYDRRELDRQTRKERIERLQRNHEYLMDMSDNWKTLKWWKLLGVEVLRYTVTGGALYLFWDFLNKFIL